MFSLKTYIKIIKGGELKNRQYTSEPIVTKINGTTFYLDPRYDLVMDLISAPFARQAEAIDRLYGYDDRMARVLIGQELQKEYFRDPAMAYFLSMALLNYGELEKSQELTLHTYRENPDNLLARCAYANNLIFQVRIDEIPTVMSSTFDLSKISKKRELPLIEFIKFMDIAGTYYYLKKDFRFADYVSILMKAAPNHPDTKIHLRNLLSIDSETTNLFST